MTEAFLPIFSWNPWGLTGQKGSSILFSLPQRDTGGTAEMTYIDKLESFFAYEEDGVSNLEKVRKNQKVIRRLPTTDLNRSFEESGSVADSKLPGAVIKDGNAQW